MLQARRESKDLEKWSKDEVTKWMEELMEEGGFDLDVKKVACPAKFFAEMTKEDLVKRAGDDGVHSFKYEREAQEGDTGGNVKMLWLQVSPNVKFYASRNNNLDAVTICPICVSAGTQSKKVTFAFAIGITPGRQNLGNPGTMPTTSKKDQWGLSEAQKKFISMLSLTFRLTLDQPSGSGSTKITLPDFPVCPSLWSRTMSLIFAGKENLAPTRQT
ncbi:hypothetical protein AAMO2058_000192000 [Amorphochlora amoebiformis]